MREGDSTGVSGVIVVGWGKFVVVVSSKWVLVHCRQKVRERVAERV